MHITIISKWLLRQPVAETVDLVINLVEVLTELVSGLICERVQVLAC